MPERRLFQIHIQSQALLLTLLALSACSINLYNDHSRRFAFIKIPDGWLYQQIILAREGNPEVFQLTNDPNFGCDNPAWSPDGSSIAFSASDFSEPSPVSQVYVIKGNGSGKKKLSQTTSEEDSRPSWSPGGRQIAWYTYTSGGETHLIVANADGSNQHDRTPSLNLDGGKAPSWSPDGRMIVLCAYLPAGEIIVVDVDTGSYRRLTNNGFDDKNPVWSPDGRKIVYQRDIVTSQLVTCDPDGSGEIVLTTNDGNNVVPSWSLDGRSILFLSDHDNPMSAFTLRVIRRDRIDEDLEICTLDIYTSNTPVSFSPDGLTILCATNGAPYRIISVRIDGSGYQVYMTNPTTWYDQPVWVPR